MQELQMTFKGLVLHDHIDLPLEHIRNLLTPYFKNMTIKANQKNTTTATKETAVFQPAQASIASKTRHITVYHVEAGDQQKGPQTD